MIYFLNTVGVFIFVAAIFTYLLFIQKNRREALEVLLSVIIAGIASILLKELFSEPRPFLMSTKEPLAGLDYMSSFPSFHTSLAFAAATTVFYRQKTLGTILLIIGLIIGIGRILANVHYPIDIAFGILIGVLTALFFEQFKFFQT